MTAPELSIEVRVRRLDRLGVVLTRIRVGRSVSWLLAWHRPRWWR